jgi:hypothetical protein
LFALTGRQAEAQAILRELLGLYRAHRATPMEIATLYAGWKDANTTLAWIERAVTANDKDLVGLNLNAQFGFLRTEPRFTAIIVDHLHLGPR